MIRSSSSSRMDSRDGFTLLELLIAIAIFSIMSVSAYTGLRNYLSIHEQYEAHERIFAAVQSGINLIEADLQNLAPRPIRDQFGDPVAALNARGESDIELSRHRPGLPLEFGLVDLMRVDYFIENNQLIRRSWDVLDRTPVSQATERILLNGVSEITWRFFGNGWSVFWPLNRDPLSARLLPRAIEFSIDFEDGRSISRLVTVVNKN